MHAPPPVSSGQPPVNSQSRTPAASLPTATLKAAAAGSQLAAAHPSTAFASPSPAMALLLCRSLEFPTDNPVETNVVREKQYTASDDSADKIEKKMNAVPIEEILSTLDVDIDTEDVEKAFSSFSNKLTSRLGTSKGAAQPTQVALNDQQRLQLNRSLASLFGRDPRLIERMSLPLELFLEQGLEGKLDSNIILHISRKAMENCIIPCLRNLAPDHPIPIDFAFCHLEKDALVPLLKMISIAPNNPTIRIPRQLTSAEKKAMHKRIQEICKHLPVAEHFTEGKDPWYFPRFIERQQGFSAALQNAQRNPGNRLELDKAKRELDDYRKHVLKHSVKAYFEPIYYVTNVNPKSTDPVQFEESYQWNRLVKIEHGSGHCEWKRSALAGSFSYTVGKLQHQQQIFKRQSLENHPNRLPVPQSIVAAAESLAKPKDALPLNRKPLPPAPKGKAPAAGSREGSSSGSPAAMPPNLSFKEQGDFYFGQKKFVPAFEAYSQALREAEKSNQKLLMADCMKDLGRVDMEQGEWVRGAKLLNGALALCPSDAARRQSILNLMVELDKRFLKNVFGASDQQLAQHPGPDKYLERREALKEMRHFSQSKDSSNRTEGTMKTFTRGMKLFLQKMFEECFSQTGNPPCASTLIALGSFGREEMCFSSDLEFAALIAINSPAYKDWFCKAFSYLELQVIHLGETEHPILKGGFSATLRGFSYDKGGNTPLGKIDRKKPLHEQYEALLIKTPQEMANLQSPTNYNRDIILTNALKGVDFIMGNQTLYDQYVQGMNSILNGLNPKDTLSIRKRRALDLIAGHLPEFKPDVSMRKQDYPAFEVKAELCRLPMFLIQGLCEYLGIDTPNTWDKLRALQTSGFSTKGMENLNKALIYAFQLRLRLHRYYGHECDVAYHLCLQATPEKRDPMIEKPYYLSKDEILHIIFIYRVLFPLHRAFQRFKETTNLEELKKQTFFEETLFTQWEMSEQSRPNMLRTPAIAIQAPSGLTTPQETPAVRSRVIQSLAQACGTTPAQIEKEMQGLNHCKCYQTTIISHGFYQDCLLTAEFIEKALVPFLHKHRIQQLDLTFCQPDDKDALIPLMRKWDELSIKKLILPRMISIPETTAYLEKVRLEKIDQHLAAFAKVLELLQNPYAIDQEFLSIVDTMMDDREAGPYSNHPTALLKLIAHDFECSSYTNGHYRIKFNVETIEAPVASIIPGMPQTLHAALPPAPSKVMTTYDPTQKLEREVLVRRIVQGFAYALNEEERQIIANISNIQTCLCYYLEVVDPFSGFHRACGLTAAAIDNCLIPLVKRFRRERLDLTLCQPEPDALIPLIQAWPELKLRLLILPRPLTLLEGKEFQQREKEIRALHPELPNYMNVLHVRVNPYFSDQKWANYVRNLRQKTDKISAEPNALLDLTVKVMKIGSDNTLQCEYQEGSALPHRDDFPLPGYSSNLNRSDAYFSPSKQLPAHLADLLNEVFNAQKDEEVWNNSKGRYNLFSMADLETKMAQQAPSQPLGRVVEKPNQGLEEPILEGK